jgi:hypothetical protein
LLVVGWAERDPVQIADRMFIAQAARTGRSPEPFSCRHLRLMEHEGRAGREAISSQLRNFPARIARYRAVRIARRGGTKWIMMRLGATAGLKVQRDRPWPGTGRHRLNHC